MTERDAPALRQERDRLGIGRSSLHWDGSALVVEFDEIAAPIPLRVRGSVRVIPRAIADHAWILDSAQMHRWTPIAPAARVEVHLQSPSSTWSGDGYLDTNRGDEPLETNLQRWTWSRGHLGTDTSVVLYDVVERNGAQTSLALAFDRHARAQAYPLPALARLSRSGWRIDRTTRSEDGVARVVRSLQDAPFYARALVSSRQLGQSVTCMHETLDLQRFRSPIVQAMLPFRMPRRSG